MDDIDDPYAKAREIGLVGANEYRPYSVTGSIEDLKYDYRRIDDLSGTVEGREIHVYSIDAVGRYIAEMVEERDDGTYYTSLVFERRPNKRKIATGFRVAAQSEFEW